VKAICQDVFGEGFAYAGEISNPGVQVWHNEAAIELAPQEAPIYRYRSKQGTYAVTSRYCGIALKIQEEILELVPDETCKEQKSTELNQ
jgi:hypothetical protein